MKIFILEDSKIKPIPSYTSEDCKAALKKSGHKPQSINLESLAELKREACDCLIFTYETGNIEPSTISHIMELHKQGMSLLIFGDIPHIDKWYPYRNNYSFEMHVTRCNDHARIGDLTQKGKEILGEIDMSSFQDRDICVLRITGFPEDKTHNLLQADMGTWTLPCLVAIERKGEGFCGARMAQMGFSGGEPREVAAGVYPLEWKYDIGPLTRDWDGMEQIAQKLVEWCRPKVDAAIEITPVHREDEKSYRNVRVSNPATTKQSLSNLRLELIQDDNNIVLQEWDKVILDPGEKCLLEININAENLNILDKPGLHKLILTGSRNDENIDVLHETSEHVISNFSSQNPIGFGVSSHRGHKEPFQSKEDKHFLKEVLKRGCQYVRLNVPWEEIEPNPGEYNWGLTDDMITFAEEQNITVSFWIFPTVRASGLGDSGIPEWTLKEPAIDREGHPGNFPTIWSPFYRNHYFNMIENLSKRYANAKQLDRLIVDFGNSDFAYGYYYYVNDLSLFDYSTYERKAFIDYLIKVRGLSLQEIGELYNKTFSSDTEVPVPFIEEGKPWSIYLDFRQWSIQEGIAKAQKIIETHAPDKLPPDSPGHGLGSLSDLTVYWYDIKRRHWDEEQLLSKDNPKLTRIHCAAPFWGGEAWQVGGGFKELDEALFGGIRFNASYNTVPGPDLNVDGEVLARIAYIRRSIMGAERRHPEIAVMGEGAWHDIASFPQVGARLDMGVDYLHLSHRFDFSCYRLLALPSHTIGKGKTTTGGGGGLRLSVDKAYGDLLLNSVSKGLNLVVFPETCPLDAPPSLSLPLRQMAGLEGVKYRTRKNRRILFPEKFGGGIMEGTCQSLMPEENDEVLIKDDQGEAVLIRRPYGKGSLLLAGWDDAENSIDSFDYNTTISAKDHTLIKLAQYIGVQCRDIRTGEAVILKDKLVYNEEEFFIAFSHLDKTIDVPVQIRLDHKSKFAMDMATGEKFELKQIDDEWVEFDLKVHSRAGRYLRFFPED